MYFVSTAGHGTHEDSMGDAALPFPREKNTISHFIDFGRHKLVFKRVNNQVSPPFCSELAVR